MFFLILLSGLMIYGRKEAANSSAPDPHTLDISTEKIGSQEMTIQEVIDSILLTVPGAPVKNTIDTFKAGDPSQNVTGIVTTFLASHEVIQRAAEFGANLIITHEPTFYNHADNVEWLKDNPVYQAKIGLIEEKDIVIWRFHDHWHLYKGDGIQTGVAKALEWDNYTGEELAIYDIPDTTLRKLVGYIKEKLGIHTVRVMGDLEMTCRRAALLPGFAGVRRQVQMIEREDVDVVLCGEVHEWETCEYVRDAVTQGQRKALIVLGHANGEEPGMAWCAEWLRQRFPNIPVTHIPLGDPFQNL